MLRHIQGLYSNDKNSRILGFELIIFFIIFGIAYRSWLVLSLVLVGLSWLMSRPKGTVYMIYAFSSLWGCVPRTHSKGGVTFQV